MPGGCKLQPHHPLNEFTSHISKTHVVPIYCNMGVHSGSEFIMYKYVFGVHQVLTHQLHCQF